MDPLEPLRRIYPGDRLLERPAQLVAYESDGLTAFRARPRAVVLPVDRREVIETVRFCHREGLPFVARGSGTSLSGGSMPVEDGLVIALNRLDRILHLDPAQRLAVVEPGVINAEITRVAEPHGLYYAPDPSSQQVCTIGGNIAFNSGGAHCLKYGMTSNHLLGLEAVLADGEVVRVGGEGPETVGPDLVGLFCGHEGLFGVVLEATVQLLPRPEVHRTVLAAYDSLERAGAAVAEVIASGVLPAALEIMDRLILDAVEAAVGADYPAGAAAVLIVELDGERDATDADFARLEPLIRSTGAFEVRVAQDDAERERIWRGRKSAFSAVGRLSPQYLVQDGVVPRTRLAEALAAIERLSRQYDIPVANVFHAGDGNLHPLILFGDDAKLDDAEALAGDILDLCIELGGSITGEHGVGMEKRAHLPSMFSDVDLEVMADLRRAVDPKGIANRGKMFPGGEAPALSSRGPHPLERAGIASRL
ncbi:MAG: FAD-linked oxidase C-terminal domain-containing protein [Acidobacteriota bacterium]